MVKLIFSIFCLVVSAILVFSAGGTILNGGSDSVWSPLLGENKQGLQELLAERDNLNQTLANSERITKKIIDLQKIENSISPADLDKLDKFIPNHVDNVNLLIDVNNIALKQGMIIKNVRVPSASDSASSVSLNKAGPGGISSAVMSFSVTGSYNALMGFLDDLSSSLRVIDPTALSFSVDEKGLNQYNFEIKTYWVK